MRTARVRFTVRRTVGAAALAVLMLAQAAGCVGLDDPPATPIGRGTIVSIEIDETALRDKLRRHNSLWVVTIRPDDHLSGRAPGRDMRFTMHSPAMYGFSRVGQRVEVYSGDGRGLRATPCPPGTLRQTAMTGTPDLWAKCDGQDWARTKEAMPWGRAKRTTHERA